MGRTVDIEKLRSAVDELKTPQRVSAFYGTTYEVAEKLIAVATAKKPHEFVEPKPVITPAKPPPQKNPKKDKQDAEQIKKYNDSAKASKALLVAMLTEGQHWLSDNDAIETAKRIGLLPQNY